MDTLQKNDLEKYLLHSIQVGACVLLYEMGKSATFFKNRLCWKSDSFMDYLHDTTPMTMLHVACL